MEFVQMAHAAVSGAGVDVKQPTASMARHVEAYHLHLLRSLLPQVRQELVEEVLLVMEFVQMAHAVVSGVGVDATHPTASMTRHVATATFMWPLMMQPNPKQQTAKKLMGWYDRC
jgi:hypothetical protein